MMSVMSAGCRVEHCDLGRVRLSHNLQISFQHLVFVGLELNGIDLEHTLMAVTFVMCIRICAIDPFVAGLCRLQRGTI